MDNASKRALAQTILERAVLELDKIDMPGVLVSWTDDGVTPDFIIVSDAPDAERALGIISLITKARDQGTAEITYTKGPRVRH